MTPQTGDAARNRQEPRKNLALDQAADRVVRAVHKPVIFVIERREKMQIAYYHETIPAFVLTDEVATLGKLTRAHGFVLEHEQRYAWGREISVMKQALQHFKRGNILFEFAIPRMGKRADVVLVIDGVILVLEFKVGAKTFDRSAIEQAHDYALDLKNFHRGSHALPIIPVVVATGASPNGAHELRWASDMVATPLLAGVGELPQIINHSIKAGGEVPIDFDIWLSSGYHPTPTIVEAAQALYQQHGVEEIARSDAGARNLGVTTDCIAQIIDQSKKQRRRAICLVTGVPGAGKTLAGLNIATKRAQEHSDEHAVFLSGNGPLVAVLREALARDEQVREGTNKKDAYRKVSSFIQNIHHFRDEAIRDPKPPHEHVVIFDEAQRAWTREQAEKFMKTKRQVKNFTMSE